MTLRPGYLSVIIVFAMLLCIGCEPESNVHVLSDPADEPAAEETQQPQEEPVEEEQVAAEPPAQATMPEDAPLDEIAAPAQTQEVQPVEEPQMQSFPDEVAAIVNGEQITEGELQEMIQPQLDRMLARTRGRKRPEDFIENTKKRLRGRALEGAVLDKLVEQDLQKHNVVITEEQINEHIQEMAQQQDMTVDDLKTIVEASGKTFEQWKEQMQFDKRLTVVELIKMRGLGDIDVTEAEAMEYYNDNQQRYKTPEQVRVSHILIKPDTSTPGTDPNQAEAQAHQKAQQLLEQIEQGADFAELAREHSDCPSAEKGGDLGFGQRRSWLKSFSDAAFGLEPGQLSGLVKTRHGYHVIKCTDRKEAGMQSFEEVKDDVINMLRAQKHQKLIQQYIELLKSEADITYPPGKKPEEIATPMR